MKASPALQLLVNLVFLTPLCAAPTIESVSGSVVPHQSITIHGAGFGDKDPARPLVWADFENGLEPTPLGRKTKWDEIQNMEIAPRGWHGRGARAKDGSGIWTMRVDDNEWTKDGQKIYIFRHQRANFLITDKSQNWKIWRMWASGATHYPNIYAAENNGRVYVENIQPECGFWGDFRHKSDDWTTEEFLFRASSQPGVKDGLLSIRYNGHEVAAGTLITRCPDFPSTMTRNYVVHGVVANKEKWSPPWSDTNRIWVDDVYVDKSWARVMLGDEPTAVTSRHWEIQIPASWSDGAITVHANPGAFLPGHDAYLYVFDKNGIPNADGFPVMIGGGPQVDARSRRAAPRRIPRPVGLEKRS